MTAPLPRDPEATDPAGVWLRHVPHGADPRARPVPAPDNRWQRGSVVDALYLARDLDTMWAEWYRHLAERGLPPQRGLPRDVWRFRVSSLRVADLSDPARLAALGLEQPNPGRGGWKAFQRVGEGLWRDGWQGLLAPSAARPEGQVLCLFITDPAQLPATPLRPPRTVIQPPAPPRGMRT